MRLTRKKAIELCIELWTWCMETGKRKEKWPRWEEFSYIQNYCWFCEYDRRQKSYHGGDNCTHCPLTKIGISHCSESYYRDWRLAKIPQARKKYAKLFLEQIKKCK